MRKLGNLWGFTGGNYGGNVYDKQGISPLLTTGKGGSRVPLIIEIDKTVCGRWKAESVLGTIAYDASKQFGPGYVKRISKALKTKDSIAVVLVERYEK